MRDNIETNLRAHKARSGHPFRLGIANMGGTLLCLPNDRGELAPVRSQSELLQILRDGADFGSYMDEGLLDMRVLYHNPVDSSQMLDTDRDPVLTPLHDAYRHVDGVLVVHGTDTAPETARFLHLALPYNDPVAFLQEGKIRVNWTKPVIVVSSQESAAQRRGEELVPKPGSDADVNLISALLLLSDGKVGEAGLMTNGYEILRGAVSRKASESRVPPFVSDPGVAPVATRTAFGASYTVSDYLVRRDDAHLGTVIKGSAKYERNVLLVSDDAHLALCRAYLDARDKGEDALVDHLEAHLPRVILYASKGAGNVQKDQYTVLKRMSDLGVYVARVPLDGGRVPPEMHYDVPGGDLPGLNIEAKAARYKAQVGLALLDSLATSAQDRKDTLTRLMQFEFGKEVLPVE